LLANGPATAQGSTSSATSIYVVKQPRRAAPLRGGRRRACLLLRLIYFHVKTFRNSARLDRGRRRRVTYLVGKNQAGKSAVLQALHTLNPANASAPLTLLDEYPTLLRRVGHKSPRTTPKWL